MITFLHRAGARAVVFDMYFSEPDMDRPEISGVDSDAALAAATAFTSNAVHSYVLQTDGETALPDKIETVKRASAFTGHGADAIPALRQYTTGALPEPALTVAAAAIGYATQEPETDNICRRFSLLARFDDVPVMSQTLAAAAFLNGEAPMRLEPGRFHLGDAVIAVDDSASAYLRWYPPPAGRTSPFTHHSAYNILRAAILQEAEMETEIPPETFKDRIVFIGSTAPGLFDNWATPLSKSTPGVEIQATALANLLRGECVTRVTRRLTLPLIALAALATAAATGLGRRRTTIVIAVPLLLLAAIVTTGYIALLRADLFLEIVPPALAVLSTFLVTTLVNYLTERKHSRMVRGIFEHYLDSSVVENLIADPEKVRLGGERRECTVLFTDVADFTTTSESLTPEQVVHFMNIYLDAMTDIIIEEGGFVDKFIGDEIVAVFGAPNVLPDHAARACRATLRMAEKVKTLQPAFREAGCRTTIFARTGMCTGEVVIGNMGSESRMNYTAMGNTMNLGARIQGITKMYGAMVFVSQSTADAAGDREFVFREVDAVRVKGKRQAEHMVELLGLRRDEAEYAERIERYAAALTAYRQRRWDEALAQLAPLEALGDGPAITLAARSREFRNTPPSDDWDGISNMLSK
jgi:adenylate cyclase